MFRIRLQAPKITLSKGWSEAMRERVRTQIRQAARELVKETIKHIPVDSGQAMGTVLPLSRFLRVSVNISAMNSTDTKNPESGASSQNQLLFKFESTKTGEKFEVDPQLFYFWLNDTFGNPQGGHGPWNSLEEGWRKFNEYLRDVAPKRYPKLQDFFVYETKTYE